MEDFKEFVERILGFMHFILMDSVLNTQQNQRDRITFTNMFYAFAQLVKPYINSIEKLPYLKEEARLVLRIIPEFLEVAHAKDWKSNKEYLEKLVLTFVDSSGSKH